MSKRGSRHELRWIGAVLLLAAGGCADEREDVARKTIGPAGGLVSSHDEVLTLVFQPGALEHDEEIEIFPSDEPPLVFGPAYRVRPDIELAVDVEVTYRRVLPADAEDVTVGAIRLTDYTQEMGHWVPLRRLSLDEGSGAVLSSDGELSLYYGLLDHGARAAEDAANDPTDGDPTDGDPSDGDSTGTNPPGGGCDGSLESCFASSELAMGGGPVDVVLGDFDGSGSLDVATANGGTSTFSVRLNDGSGAFGSELGADAGSGPVAIGAADFDAQGGDDLVVVAGSQLSLLQSQGDGTFALMPVTLTGTGPSEVLVADFNGDGGPDIVVANQGSATVSLFAGGLGPAIDRSTGMVGAPAGLAFGQYNANDDAFGDLLAFGGASYAALPGDGTTLTDSPLGGALGTDLRRAVGGDLGGGTPGDAAVADFAQGGVHVILGNGAANGIEAMAFYATGAGALDVAAGDVTGDGEIDLVVANSGADTVTVLEKTGDDAWADATDFDVGAGPSGVGVGDLNGDGVADIVVSCEAGNVVTILLSNP